MHLFVKCLLITACEGMCKGLPFRYGSEGSDMLYVRKLEEKLWVYMWNSGLYNPLEGSKCLNIKLLANRFQIFSYSSYCFFHFIEECLTLNWSFSNLISIVSEVDGYKVKIQMNLVYSNLRSRFRRYTQSISDKFVFFNTFLCKLFHINHNSCFLIE